MKFLLAGFIGLFALFVGLYAQEDQGARSFSGTVYDEHFNPVPYTSVFATGTGEGDMTDSLGIFTLHIRKTDRISFYNISYRDTAVWVSWNDTHFYMKLRPRIYSLPGARIFKWGSTYEEMKTEFKNRGVPEELGEELGLPRQDPDHVPFEMDERKLKSPGFLLTSPVSFFYYNLSKREKHARRAYRLEKNKTLTEQFNRILSPENISGITGLEGRELESFIIYLNRTMNCTYRCSEIELVSEVLKIWNEYKERPDGND